MNETGRVSASDLVVNNIRSKIQRGELKVGDRLPVEADLARELNVGRSSLREGIKILTAYGVVESRQGEGTFITDNVARNFFEYMGFFPSKENSEYLVELRRVIEVGNIAAIYDRVTPQQYDQLEKLVDVFDEEHTIDEYVEADYNFHNMLIEITGNPMLIQVNNMIAQMRRDLLYRMFSHPEIIQDARISHRAIFNSLKAKDRDAIRAELGAGDRTVILSFGGSLGARRVNEVVADLCAWEQHEKKPVLHLHATGQYGVQLFKDLEQQKGFAEGDSLVVKEYINNMPELLAAADLVISRAGALTLAELEAVGRAAVLIPSPNVAENHQYYNAMELQKAGAAVVIEEKDLTGEKLVAAVKEMTADPEKLREISLAAKALGVPNACGHITDELLDLYKTHRK